MKLEELLNLIILNNLNHMRMGEEHIARAYDLEPMDAAYVSAETAKLMATFMTQTYPEGYEPADHVQHIVNELEELLGSVHVLKDLPIFRTQ